MATPDPLAIVVAAALRTGSALQTQGIDVRAVSAPEGWANGTRLVVLRMSGGLPDGYLDTLQVQIEAYCYGGSEKHIDAMTVWRYTLDSLHQVRGLAYTAGRLLWCDADSGPTQTIDEESEFPVVIGTFTAEVSPL